MEDPFTSMIYKCRISSSQENLLDRSLFAFESQEGLITPLTQEESSSYPDEFPVDNTGIIICSPPDGSSSDDESSSEEERGKDQSNPLVEEYHTPPEGRGGLDELNVDDDRDEVYRDADAVLDASQGTIDLGKDNFLIGCSQGKSFEVSSSQIIGTVCVDDVEKPCDNEESRVNMEGIGESESNLHAQEDLGLGFIEPMITGNQGLNESPHKNLIESQHNLNSEEDSVEDIAEKTLQSLINKNLGLLKCNPDNPYDSQYTPQKSVVTSLAVENEEGVDVDTSNRENVERSSDNIKEDLPVIAIGKDIEEVDGVMIDAQEVRDEYEAAQKCHQIAISVSVRTENVVDDPVLPDSSKDVVMNDDLPAYMENVEMNAVEEIVLNSQPDNSIDVVVPQCIKDVEMEDLPLIAPAKDIGEAVHGVTFPGQEVRKESTPAEKDVVMTDSSLIPDEVDFGNETNGGVSGFQNPQTDVHIDDGESGIVTVDELEKFECADSTDSSSGLALRNSPALRKLPNWAERGSSSAAEGSNRSGNSRAGRVETFDFTGNIRRNTGDMMHEDDTELVKKLHDVSHFMANLQNTVEDKPEEEKEDILETATKVGLNIPRPRWWKPEGYET